MTVTGTTPPDFGIAADLLSLVTQKVSSTRKVDKKEGKNRTGDVVAVAYYNENTEISIEGLGEVDLTLAASIAASGIASAGGTFYAEEVTIEYGNEEFVKSSVKGMAYSQIT